MSEEQLVAKLMDVENTTPTITSSRVAKAICEINPSYKKEELNITNWIESVFEKETKDYVTRNNIQP